LEGVSASASSGANAGPDVACTSEPWPPTLYVQRFVGQSSSAILVGVTITAILVLAFIVFAAFIDGLPFSVHVFLKNTFAIQFHVPTDITHGAR
jgi:hypothetical protein